MTIRIFNPDHDLALASNQKRFTAPHAGRKLRSDLSFFPALWSEDGDIVIVEDIDAAESAYHKLGLRNKPRVEFCTMEQLPHILKSGDSIASPEGKVFIDVWGWDRAICFQLEKNGVPSSLLPTDGQLSKIRELSSREFSSQILSDIRRKYDVETCGKADYVTDMKCFNAMLLKYDNQCVAKAPWSCSGRGVKYFLGNVDSEHTKVNTMNWVSNTIDGQGGVMVEPLYNKVKDFAVEFKLCNYGKVIPVGYSLFDTKNGAYTGNLLATEEEKREILSRYIDMNLLDGVVDEISVLMEYALSPLVNTNISMHFGVDMLIVAKGSADGFLLHPCVEINLRRTMGLAALSISPREKCNKSLMSIFYESKKYHLSVRKLLEQE